MGTTQNGVINAGLVSAHVSLLGQEEHHSGFKSVLFCITQTHIYFVLFFHQTHLWLKKVATKSVGV